MYGKTLRLVRRRESRARQKERYHHLAFIAEYTERKYKDIYKEADSFYQKLFKIYPNKTRLTTCTEFKAWELEIKNTQASTTTTRMAPTSSSSGDEETTTTTPIDLSLTHDIQINIPLMDSLEVQETRDTVMFQDIYPSLTEEINPEILNQVIQEIQESDVNRDIFNHTDEDINDILNSEINDSMNELCPLEKELLKY